MARKKDISLVVVESPTKAKTLRGFLPEGYLVAASMGHVRDLPESAAEIPTSHRGKEWARLGVNVEDDFQPLYVVPGQKKKVVSELKALLKGADELILATDEDREGESIGWHLLQVLEPRIPVSRIVFHEITPEAIRDALNNPREVDENVVRAQETRRILDRLVGYSVSPLLWKKIAGGLSAGRVQSVAVRLLVQRERERRAFRSASYWDLKAQLATTRTATPAEFPAQLVSVGGKRIASGRDFDETTGRLINGRDVLLLDEAAARDLRGRLERTAWKVAETEEKPTVRRPAPPFTTSTLQQEANRKLRLSARDTMRVAQRLYEEGYITYMRTDSVHLSTQAMDAARSRIRKLYGESYLSDGPRQFTTRSKGAQEAHEAIRPAGTEMRTPEEVKLTGREADLYELIWKRTVASQMAEARITQVSAQISAADAVFRASGNRIDFPGFFRAYVEGSDDPEAALEDREEPLPSLQRGEALTLRQLEPIGHETQPPARFTEASLVKTLENEGIGRPSTYATIIGTIIDRGYVDRQGNQLIPTFTALAVTELLERHFPSLVDTRFTARMEEELDEIAEGEAEWLPYLRNFFLGPEGLENLVAEGESKIDPREASTIRLQDLSATVRIGKFGPFVEHRSGDETFTASIPENIAPADLDNDAVLRLVKAKSEGPDVLGHDPATGEAVSVHLGRFGPYVQLGEVAVGDIKPKRASLPKGMAVEAVTLETALRLLALPRTLGSHPETGKEIKAGIGRFGPFVVHEKDFRSLGPEDDVYTVKLPRALELLAAPKRASRTSQALREIGPHPADGEPIVMFSGRYGPYVKHGSVNASLPKGADPQTFGVDAAVAILAERAAQGKKPARGRASGTRKGGRSALGAARGDGKAAKSAKARAKGSKAATAGDGRAPGPVSTGPKSRSGGSSEAKAVEANSGAKRGNGGRSTARPTSGRSSGQ
jgi:DNA topoisomerase I